MYQKILYASVIGFLLSGCAASSFNEMKRDSGVTKESFQINQNYQALYKYGLEKSKECYDFGLITAAYITDGQLYTELKEAEITNYMMGGLGRQMRFGATLKAISNNDTNLTIYIYGAYAKENIDILKKQLTGECKNCACTPDGK